jgi:hypothetical protein
MASAARDGVRFEDVMPLSDKGQGATTGERNAVSLVQPVWDRDPSEVPFDRSASFGLFIGIRQFGDQGAGHAESATEIPYGVDDALDLAHVFVRELELIDCRRVKLLLAGEPVKPASKKQRDWLTLHGATVEPPRYTLVYRALKELPSLKTSEARGLLVVSFATHGVYLGQDGGDRLLCSDSSRDLLKETTVPMSYVVSQIAKARAARRLALIDSCRKRPFNEQERSVAEEEQEARERFERLSQAMSAASGTAVLSATSIGGVSFDDTVIQNGVFTGQLIAGLRGQAPAEDDRGYITVRSLAAWTNEAVKRWIVENRPGHSHDSVGIGKEFFGANPEEIPLALSAATMRKTATARRDRLIAHVAALLPSASSPSVRQACKDVMRALDVAPLQPSEKLSMDKLEIQLQLVQTGGRIAFENFALWWQHEGRLLLPLGEPPVAVTRPPEPPVEAPPEVVEIAPEPPNYKRLFIAVAMLLVFVFGGMVALDKFRDPALVIAADLGTPTPRPSSPLHVSSFPAEATVRIRTQISSYICAATPCDLVVEGPGPFEVVVEKRHFESQNQALDTRDELVRFLNSIVLKAEK